MLSTNLEKKSEMKSFLGSRIKRQVIHTTISGSQKAKFARIDLENGTNVLYNFKKCVIRDFQNNVLRELYPYELSKVFRHMMIHLNKGKLQRSRKYRYDILISGRKYGKEYYHNLLSN
ncbi:hypothetical protein CMT89_08430 [Elizabethkingia anophelis]|nr:hypothetical protein [Elizabethkingia anophelis]MDV3901216.1 hypothetical protein [Elizabethkingia anophelis]MDV3904964.1 hypothetical protein [Elizabethkingia anophelis]MDV4058407.1 hypothetical protein [Elizabethkingia anophelis]